MSKKKIWWLASGLLIIIVITGIVVNNRRKPKEEYTTVTVSTGPLVQTVMETGTVKPVKEVNLNFLGAGLLADIKVQVGDTVAAGDVLAELDNSALLLRKIEAEAGLQITQANLSKVLAGASRETVAISQRSLEQAISAEQAARDDLEKTRKSVNESLTQAKNALFDLESDLPDNITPQEQAVTTALTNLSNTKSTNQKNIDNSRSSSLFTFSDKILVARIAMDNINTLLTDESARYVLSAKNSTWLQKTRDGRLLTLELLDAADEAISLANSNNIEESAVAAGEASLAALSRSRQVLSDAYFMLEATITSSEFTQVKLDNYKTLINNQITQINAAVSAIELANQNFSSARLAYSTAVLSAEENLRQAQVNLDNAILMARNQLNSLNLSTDQQINSAQARLDSATQAVSVARAQLNNTTASARPQDISLAQAQVSQAQANIASIQKQIDDNILTSPLDGVITTVNYQIGEQFAPGVKPLISVLVNNIFEIEVDISESDINKVKINDPVRITLDAFGEDTVFTGQVYFIEPAQTLIQGVVYYKVKIEFVSLEQWLAQNIELRSEIKSGMTANVEITTARRDSVLQIPARALIEQDDGQRIVRLLVNEQVMEVPVVTGLRGDDGLVEVISGLQAGDEVITFVRSLR